MEDMNTLESKEIRGLNFRNLIAIILATISICTTTLFAFAKLEKKIDQLEMQNMGDERYNDLRLKTMELNIQSFDIRLKEIENKIK